MKIFSVDAETNGLYGQAFAVAAVVTVDGREIERYVGRCPVFGRLDDFIKTEVFPMIADMEENYEGYYWLLESFGDFYFKHKINAEVIAHVAHPVETKLFRDLIELNLKNKMWEGPFPLFDVSTSLRMAGEDPLSTEKYLKKHGLSVDFDGSPHNPLYDCMSAEVVYRHLVKKE